MGISPTVGNPLTWPPTLVTLATLSMMETLPGLVGMVECGVGHLLCVSVSYEIYRLFFC